MKDRQYYFGDPCDIWRVFFSEKAPCAHCDFRFSCASKHWACADLAQYLRTGEVVELILSSNPHDHHGCPFLVLFFLASWLAQNQPLPAGFVSEGHIVLILIQIPALPPVAR